MSTFQKYVLCGLIAFALVFAAFHPASVAAATEDQSCKNNEITMANNYWLINPHTYLAQTFKPSMNFLSSVSLAIAGGADVNTTITMKLYVVGGGLATSSTGTTASANAAWIEFAFPTISVDTTKQYRIELTTPSNTARWLVSTIPCYADGKAYINGSVSENQDFGFKTFGYNLVLITTTATATPTALVIAKPTAVQAFYNSGDATIRVTWNSSTTAGIDGYRIYRSKSSSSGFAQIAMTDSASTEYIDFSGLVAGTKYYYYLKAYKGSTNSPNSSTASATVPASTTPTASPSVTETGTVTPTLTSTVPTTVLPTATSTQSMANLLMTTYFPQVLTILALLLCAVIAFVVLMSKSKRQSAPETLPEKKVSTEVTEETAVLTKTSNKTADKDSKETP